MIWIYLVLIVVVIAFGLGVVVWNRRRSGPGSVGGATVTPPAVERPPEGRGAPTAVLERAPPAAPPVEVVEPATLRGRMSRARAALAGVFTTVLGRSAITDETWVELEAALLRADLGVHVTTELLDGLRAKVKAKEIEDPDALIAALRAEMQSRLTGADRALHFDAAAAPNVWLFVGVNGVGKTTSIGKVASQQVAAGRSVLLAAGDTFRAAAAEQLATWASRADVELVRGSEGGDPSAVVFDAVERAASRHVDLVLDATAGQNGLTQAREFGEATQLTGVVLTKLDGSAKGGIVFAVETELGIPVKLVGIGETIGDLVPFDPDEFVDALFCWRRRSRRQLARYVAAVGFGH